ncbi:MAG: hypothetical protein ACE5GJ_07400 [Gemmatimonadota bacterium]
MFGFPPAPAVVFLLPRTPRWRALGAAQRLGMALLLAPLAGLVPPHAPWILGVLGVGGVLARRRWTEHFTLLALEADCPSCGAPLHVPPGRLRSPHTLSCDACHHEGTLTELPL